MRFARTAAAACFLTALCARAVVVDRIAISAGNRVITESEVELRLRLTAFQNGTKPELTLAARREAAGRLLDQKLVEREMDLGHYPRLNPEGRKQVLADYAEQYFQSDAAAMGRALAAYALSERDLEEDLARQEDLLTFLSLRFRPAVQVSEQEVQDYYRTKTNGQIPLSELRAQIEKLIINERADRDLDAWLKDQRTRTRIEYLDKDLMP
jgi:hypothetical protein